MRIYGLQANSNPILLDVISAEFDIFSCTLIFQTASGEVWKLPFELPNEALMYLRDLYANGTIHLKTKDDPKYMLQKETNNEPKRKIRRGLES